MGNHHPEFAVLEILHTLSSAYILGAFFVMGISAYHLLKKQHVDVFTRSFNIALVFGLVSSIFLVIEGDIHAIDVAKSSPQSSQQWNPTGKQNHAPVYLFAWPDEENEKQD